MRTNSLIFDTHIVRLKIREAGRAWTVEPPCLSNCIINHQSNAGQKCLEW